MKEYFKAVTLGAFTAKNEDRISLLLDSMRKAGNFWLMVHFLLITICLNFPVTLQIADTNVFFNRLYLINNEQLADSNQTFCLEQLAMNNQTFGLDQLAESSMQETDSTEGSDIFPTPDRTVIEDTLSSTQLPIPNDGSFEINEQMFWLRASFFLILIIQLVFYLSAVYFLKLSRLNVTPLSFRDRIGLAVYSSTLPVLASALFGLFLPTVHIIVFYFIIIFIIFQRSRLIR